MAVCSEVRMHGGVPTLFVNNVPLPGPAYVTYMPERADYRNFAAMGHRLYSVCAYFATRPISSAELYEPFMPGIFEKKGEPDFSIVDKEIERVLEACSDALIFPRVNVTLPEWWEEEHPEACNDKGVNGKPPRACPASPLWQETCMDLLGQFIRHMENAPYADHIVGYQIAGGQTEEWMAFDTNGNQGPALRKAFADAFPGETDPVRFREFASKANAAAIIRLTRLVKEETGGRKVAGIFYGYTFETPYWQAAHAAVQDMLREDSVDFFCSPFSYNHLRQPGIDLACMLALDSVKLHGKLYFAEGDIRTCLTLSMNESRPGSCSSPLYTGGIWEGPKDPWVNVQQLRLVFGRMLTHSHALWWFDMWGKWYDHPSFREELSRYPVLAALAAQDTDRQSTADLVVFVDEKACARSECPANEDPARLIAYENRIPLGSAGLPYDTVEIGDFEAVYQNYRCAVFLVPWETEVMTEAISRWHMTEKPCIISDPGHPLLSPEEINTAAGQAGCHIYAAPGDVLHASSRWLVYHAASAGEKTIRLPRERRAIDCITGEEWLTDRLCLPMEQYETRLFRLE
ncbi:MAG: hypothetical protein IJD13_00245 [Oscillospiraceae bacterium]|nr:hypothetical protein [Oscillospiraceae bacterium]